MKKALLLLSIISLFALKSIAQCTPDLQYTSSGIYPSIAQGLPTAYLNTGYDLTLTVVVPTDTTVSIGGFPITSAIDSIKLLSITGLPTGMTYECVPQTCAFPGSSTGCIRIYGNPTVASQIGQNNLVIKLNGYGTISPGIPIPLDDVTDYFIVLDYPMGITSNVQTESKKLFPNPASSECNLMFNESGSYKISILNLIGQKVYETNGMVANNAKVSIPVNELPEGIYMVEVKQNQTKELQRLVVTRK